MLQKYFDSKYPFWLVRDFHKYCNGMAKQNDMSSMAESNYYYDYHYLSEDASGGQRAGRGWRGGRVAEPLYLLDDNCDNIRTLARRNRRCLKIDVLNL